MNDLKELLRYIQAQPGWTVEQAKRRAHFHIISPEGRRLSCPCSPGDRRGILNMRSDLRKLGLDLPPSVQKKKAQRG